MGPEHQPSPLWATRWLQAAGVYNLVWGAVVVAAPNALFDLAGMQRMQYPEIWQCVGMVVGVYGVAYLLAARDHRTHWPIVLVGLLGKILGPIGFALAFARGTFSPVFAITILTNDLVWWIPFGMMLWDAARSRGQLPSGPAPSLDTAMESLVDQHGRDLRSLTEGQPALVVLLRHAGCTFCRETLDDLSRKQNLIRDRGYRIAVVTMSDDQQNARLGRTYGLESASWFSDPDRIAYRALELRRGGFMQLFGPRVLFRGVMALLRGHGLGLPAGDGFQMPGAFVIRDGRLVRMFRHQRASDRPDYQSFACEMPQR